jgi:hypothetical protein
MPVRMPAVYGTAKCMGPANIGAVNCVTDRL